MAVTYSSPQQPTPQKLLSAKQLRAIIELSGGKTQAQTAKIVGTSEQTLSAWMQDPGFHNQLQETVFALGMDDEQFAKHMRRRAMLALAHALEHPQPTVQMRAALEILDRFRDHQEEVDATTRAIIADVMGTEPAQAFGFPSFDRSRFA